LLDSGNFSDNPTPAGDRKTTILLQAMDDLGYAAANVGERDLKGGYDRFRERSAEAKLTLLSANIVRADTKRPVFHPYAVVEATAREGGKTIRVGLIGVARFNPLFRKPGPEGSELEIVHPVERVKQELAALKQQGVELVILLAAMHREDARRLLQELPGIDFVVGSYGGMAATQVDEPTGTWLLYSGNQGKRLGESRIFLGKKEGRRPPINRLHYLTSVYPADEKMMVFLNRAGAESRAAKAEVVAGSPYVGSQRCRHCHAEAYGQWASTAHATAFATLEREQNHHKPECLNCHTTAPGVPGGFRSYQTTPAMAAVSCETCHGPGRAHSDSPQAGYGKVELTTCTPCHDAKNSPDFDYYSYRDRVAHRDRGAR
jgi:2',3'-cyclic-nucleotide 2'-phosphodiesterase (5'-nucleotidase family)